MCTLPFKKFGAGKICFNALSGSIALIPKKTVKKSKIVKCNYKIAID